MDNQTQNNFQVILITWKRKELLRKCLKSLQEAGIDFKTQLILVINGRDSEAVDMLESEYPDLGYEQINRASPAEARNHALSQSSSPWIFFIDDDSWVDNDYFTKASKVMNSLSEVAAFGGPDLTPVDSNLFQSAIGKTLTSPMATASTRYRHRDSKKINSEPVECNEKKLILCNLWINSNVLKKHDLNFPSELGRNEENVLLHQLEKLGQKLYYVEDLAVYHQRSHEFSNVFRKAWLSGFYRMKSFLVEPSSIELIFFIPALFVLYLFSIFLCICPLYLIPVGLYLILVGFFSIRTGSISRPKELGLIIILHIVINIGYGLGSLSGLIKKDAY